MVEPTVTAQELRKTGKQLSARVRRSERVPASVCDVGDIPVTLRMKDEAWRLKDGKTPNLMPAKYWRAVVFGRRMARPPDNVGARLCK